MDKESMSDQIAMTPSWPPPATTIMVPSLPLQHHVQLALVGRTRLGGTAIHHLHGNKPQESVTQNTKQFYYARPGIIMYRHKNVQQVMVCVHS
jgi:hypothetical protein